MTTFAARIFWLNLIIMLACACQSAAQGCGGWMNPQYSTYESESTDGTYIYTSVIVDGTSTGTCPFGCGCSGVQHYGKAYNKTGSLADWVNGSYVPWNGYVSTQNNNQVTDPSGTNLQFVGEGVVVCTAVGTIYSVTLPTITLAIRDTYWGPPPIETNDTCYYTILACSTGTPTCKSAPPGITFVPSCPNYMHGHNLVVNGVCEFSLGTAATGPGPCN